MNRTLTAALIGSLLLVAPAARAQDASLDTSTMDWLGTVGFGGQLVDTKGTVVEGKLRGYRDMTSFLWTLFNL